MRQIAPKIKVILILLSFFCFFSHALSKVNEEKNRFSISAANKTLDVINTRLATQELELGALQKAAAQLTVLHDASEKCVEEGEKQLSQINGSILSIGGKKPVMKADHISADANYLKEKKEKIRLRVAGCRLFALRAKETIRAYNDAIQKLSTSKLFQRDPSFWQAVFKEKGLFSGIRFGREKTQWQKQFGLVGWSALSLFFVFFVPLLGVGLGFWLRRKIKQYLGDEPDVAKVNTTISVVFQKYIVWLLPFSFLSVLFGVVFWENFNPFLELLFYEATLLLISFVLIDLLFSPPLPAQRALLWHSKKASALASRLKILVVLLFVGFVSFIGRDLVVFSGPLLHLVISLYITLLGVNLIWVALIVNHSKLLVDRFHYIRYFVNATLFSLTGLILLSQWAGYHNFSVYLVTASIKTLLLGFLAWLAFHFVRSMISGLNYSSLYVPSRVRYFLGIKPQRRIPELVLIKFSIYLIIVMYFVTFFMTIWGVSQNHIDEWINLMVSGFDVAKLHIVPARLVFSILSFSVVLLIGRWISAFVARQNQFQAATDTQVAMASIVGYVFFAVAVLVALLVAGANFTSLAIIAGALSVGMGLGLQNAVNNFVSGLILLIEKPIKPGDRVLVGETEGFVKRVNIRSTRIVTLAHEDIIIPNADLVSKEVTNYMFRDRSWRVACQVGVAYGSDIDLVESTLLEVAKSHPEVVQEGDDAVVPRVLFREFGESSLVFELWCIIKDVNQKYVVHSELNFLIDKAFRQKNITIAFPQRDIHIKNAVGIVKE